MKVKTKNAESKRISHRGERHNVRDAIGLSVGVGLLAVGSHALMNPSEVVGSMPAPIFGLKHETTKLDTKTEAMYTKFADTPTHLIIGWSETAQTGTKGRGLPRVWNKDPDDPNSGIDRKLPFVRVAYEVQRPDGSFEEQLFHVPTRQEPVLRDTDGAVLAGVDTTPSLGIAFGTEDGTDLNGSYSFGDGDFTADLTAFEG